MTHSLTKTRAQRHSAMPPTIPRNATAITMTPATMLTIAPEAYLGGGGGGGEGGKEGEREGGKERKVHVYTSVAQFVVTFLLSETHNHCLLLTARPQPPLQLHQ